MQKDAGGNNHPYEGYPPYTLDKGDEEHRDMHRTKDGPEGEHLYHTRMQEGRESSLDTPYHPHIPLGHLSPRLLDKPPFLREGGDALNRPQSKGVIFGFDVALVKLR